MKASASFFSAIAEVHYWQAARIALGLKFVFVPLMNTILEQIKQFADRAHGEQMRKYTPERYIVHPIRVMEITKDYDNKFSVLAAALLHDVFEDTSTTPLEMKAFLLQLTGAADAKRVVHLVHELTDVYTKANFPQWNRYTRKRKEMERLEKTSPDAQTIKYADLIDNMAEIARQDPDFAKRYLDEARNLLNRLKRGNKALRDLAITTLERSLETLRAHSSPHDYTDIASPSKS
jgi:(p)ppGpp synthase/HD superfamily hydrolase